MAQAVPLHTDAHDVWALSLKCRELPLPAQSSRGSSKRLQECNLELVVALAE